MGPLIPSFGPLVTSVLGFKARVDPFTCALCHLCATESSDLPLKQHLLTSWRPVWHPSSSYPRTWKQWNNYLLLGIIYFNLLTTTSIYLEIDKHIVLQWQRMNAAWAIFCLYILLAKWKAACCSFWLFRSFPKLNWQLHRKEVICIYVILNWRRIIMTFCCVKMNIKSQKKEIGKTSRCWPSIIPRKLCSKLHAICVISSDWPVEKTNQILV